MAFIQLLLKEMKMLLCAVKELAMDCRWGKRGGEKWRWEIGAELTYTPPAASSASTWNASWMYCLISNRLSQFSFLNDVFCIIFNEHFIPLNSPYGQMWLLTVASKGLEIAPYYTNVRNV